MSQIEDLGDMVSIRDDSGGFLVPLEFVPVLLETPPELSPLSAEEIGLLMSFAAMKPQLNVRVYVGAIDPAADIPLIVEG